MFLVNAKNLSQGAQKSTACAKKLCCEEMSPKTWSCKTKYLELISSKIKVY